MPKQHLKHINCRLTEEDRVRHADIRETALKGSPPKPGSERRPSPAGLAAQVRAARERRQLTWYALAKLAKIPNQATIRDLEQGKDVKLSNLQAIAKVLGLKLELVEQTGKKVNRSLSARISK